MKNNNSNSEDKIERKIKLTEIIVTSILVTIGVVGIILAIIGLSRYHRLNSITTKGDLENGITAILLGVFGLGIISYLFYKVIFQEHQYALELSTSGILLMISFFLLLACLVFGALSFVNSTQINSP